MHQMAPTDALPKQETSILSTNILFGKSLSKILLQNLYCSRRAYFKTP